MEYKLNFIGLSKQGNRKQNQDNYNAFLNNYGNLIVVVADGMGGHFGGEIAAKIAADNIFELFKNINFSILKEKKIKETFLISIRTILDKMKDEAKINPKLIDMGTTLNVNVFVNENIYILNIGDSRSSSITKKFVNSITIDQNLATLAQRYDKYNDIENAQSILTSSLGPKKDLRIDLYKAKLNTSGHIMVSTDGVHNHIYDEELLQILNSQNTNLEEKLNQIIDKSFLNGSNDNMTAVLIEYYVK